jgi:glyceraldehyde-3-phosphate dehydrogenase/erythrose-4-phosphate dehydrogenase
VPSASRNTLARLATAACGGALLLGATGCETTQEKAAAHRAEAERILEAREKGGQQMRKQANDRSAKDGGKRDE